MLCRLDPFLCTFVQYSITFCSLQEVGSDVISSTITILIVPNIAAIKSHDNEFNCSREHFPRFLRDDNFRPGVASDAVEVGVDVCVKLGDYRSSHSSDMRLANLGFHLKTETKYN